MHEQLDGRTRACHRTCQGVAVLHVRLSRPCARRCGAASPRAGAGSHPERSSIGSIMRQLLPAEAAPPPRAAHTLHQIGESQDGQQPGRGHAELTGLAMYALHQPAAGRPANRPLRQGSGERNVAACETALGLTPAAHPRSGWSAFQPRPAGKQVGNSPNKGHS